MCNYKPVMILSDPINPGNTSVSQQPTPLIVILSYTATLGGLQTLSFRNSVWLAFIVRKIELEPDDQSELHDTAIWSLCSFHHLLKKLPASYIVNSCTTHNHITVDRSMICVGWSFQNSSVSLKLSLCSIETVRAHISVSSRHKAVVSYLQVATSQPLRQGWATNKTIKIATRIVFLKGGL